MALSIDLPLATEALSAVPMGVLILDKQRRVVWVNDTLLRLLGMRADELVGHDAQGVTPLHREHLFTPENLMLWETGTGDAARWVQAWRQPLTDAAGGGMVHYYQDVTSVQALVTERDRLAEELASHNTRDAVTGLPNRRALLQHLEPLVSRSRRYNNPLSVIRLGVDAGTAPDHALVTIAQILRDQMRWADVVGRYDRKEFLLILPETLEEAALKLMEKLRLAVERLGLDAVTLRWGVACWSSGDDPTKLLRRAEPAA